MKNGKQKNKYIPPKIEMFQIELEQSVAGGFGQHQYGLAKRRSDPIRTGI